MKKTLLYMSFIFSVSAFATPEAIKCRVKQIQETKGVVCEEATPFPALCLTMECVDRKVYRCRSEAKDFKVKFKYRFTKATDSQNQYQAKERVWIKNVKFKPVNETMNFEVCL